VMVNATNKMYLNLNSYLNFPVLSGGITFLSNETTDIPKDFTLSQNYPNPFNPITKISFSIPSETDVTISIYDIRGRHIKTLVNEEKKAGYYDVNFNASDIASGIYFYKLKAGNFVLTKKMVIIK